VNRKVLLGSVVVGLLVGVLAAFFNSPTMTQSLLSETRLLVKAEQEIHLLEMKASINLKRSGQFELFFLSDEDVGFNSTGEYHFTQHGLSLMPTASEQVLPATKNLTLLETMFAQRGMHSMEDLKMIPYSADKLIIVAPRYSYLFSIQPN